MQPSPQECRPVPQECLQVPTAKERSERKFKETIRQNIQENIQANQAPKDTLTDVQQKPVPQECLLKEKRQTRKKGTGAAQSVPEPQALRDGNHDSHPLAAASWGSHTSNNDNDRHKKCATHSMKVLASIAHVAHPIATDDWSLPPHTYIQIQI